MQPTTAAAVAAYALANTRSQTEKKMFRIVVYYAVQSLSIESNK